MKKKTKTPEGKFSYFADSRDYAKVVLAEHAFFEGLLAAKNNIKCIAGNASLQKALKEVVGFLQDRGRPLEIVVKFHVNDPRSKVEQTLFLGTLLKPCQHKGHPQVTHFLCLADDDYLLAKVHSDLDFSGDVEERKPSPHVQMGGRVFESLIHHNTTKKLKVCWNESVDKPRLPSLPICTALLWHWAFLEYRDSEQISGFLDAWHWKELVKKAELAILRPYFVDGAELMDRHPASGLFNALYVPLNR